MRPRFAPLETAQSSLMGLTALTAAIAPLAVPALLIVLIAVTGLQDVTSGKHPGDALAGIKGNRALLLVIAFFSFAFVSCAWAIRPSASATSLLQIATLILGGWYVAASLDSQNRAVDRIRQTRFTRALPLTAIVIATYFLIEWATNNGATMAFVKNVPWLFDGFENAIVYAKPGVPQGLHETYFNRTAAAVVMMLAGLAASLRFWPNPKWGHALALAATLFAVGICASSGSSTAMLMLICGVLAFIIGNWWPSRSIRLLQALMIFATIAAIPLAMLPKTLAMEKSKLLPFSFQERVVIWSDLAHLTLERPVFGIGVNSIKHWNGPPGKVMDRQIRRLYWHPHNGYLQVWLELGLIGALLFSAAGYLLLDRIRHLASAMQPYAIALSAATLAAIGPGWSLWQPWLVGSICFGWLALLLVRFEFDAASPAS